MAKDRLPGLVVTDAEGGPTAVLPASQVFRFIVSDYVRQDPTLTRSSGKAADKIADRLRKQPRETGCPGMRWSSPRY